MTAFWEIPGGTIGTRRPGREGQAMPSASRIQPLASVRTLTSFPSREKWKQRQKRNGTVVGICGLQILLVIAPLRIFFCHANCGYFLLGLGRPYRHCAVARRTGASGSFARCRVARGHRCGKGSPEHTLGRPPKRGLNQNREKNIEMGRRGILIFVNFLERVGPTRTPDLSSEKNRGEKPAKKIRPGLRQAVSTSDGSSASIGVGLGLGRRVGNGCIGPKKPSS